MSKVKPLIKQILWLLANPQFQRLLKASGLLFFCVFFGTMGYMLIEGQNFSDAFFLAMIVISTVGMNEVAPLSLEGRIFTTIFIAANLVVVTYIVSIFTHYIFEGELQTILKNIMQRQQVKEMYQHIIVCGYGRYGRKVCEHLEANHIYNFIIIERDKSKVLEKYPDLSKISFIEGDATADDILKQAGISKASAVITSLSEDASNVYVTLTARELNPTIKIVARASGESVANKLYRAGANYVVMPDVMGGMYMANLLIRPEAVQFMELLNGIGEEKLRVDEFHYEQFKPIYQGMTLGDLLQHNTSGAAVIGFKDVKNGFEVNPAADRLLGIGDVLLVIGKDAQLKIFSKIYLQ
jgi:voltage-gated potassium channel